MEKKGLFLGFVALLLAFLLMLPLSSEAKGKEGKPIIIGCPLSTAFLYGCGEGDKARCRGDKRQGRSQRRRGKKALQGGGDGYAGSGAGGARQ